MAIKFSPKKPPEAKPFQQPEVHTEDEEEVPVNKDAPTNHLGYHFHKTAAVMREARHHNVIHISDLDPARNWCPREPALLSMHGKKRPASFLSTAQNTTFKFGDMGADLLRRFLPPERVWGHWKCRGCGNELKFTTTPKMCTKCGLGSWALAYKEVFMRDPSTGVVGSVDLFFDFFGNGFKTGIEIKTEGNESFKKRTAPTFDHEWRTRGYLRLMNADPKIREKPVNLSEMRVVYITKEGHDAAPHIKEWGLKDWGRTPIKEYWVKRSDDMVEQAFDAVMEYRLFREQLDAGKAGSEHLPERVSKCTSYGCPRAKECPVRTECWQG